MEKQSSTVSPVDTKTFQNNRNEATENKTLSPSSKKYNRLIYPVN